MSEVQSITKGWRYRLGMFFLIMMLISPVLALIVPYLKLSDNITLTVQGVLLVGGPEVFMILGIYLAGKEALTTMKNALKKMFGMPPGAYAASESQYRLGLTFVFIGMLVTFIMSYLPVLIQSGFFIEYDLWINLIGDIVFILGVFIAGEQFITKLKNLFTWDRWELNK